MPLTETGYEPTPAADLLLALRAEVNRLLSEGGFPTVDAWDDTVEGALTEAVAVMLGRTEEVVRLVYDSLDPSTASGALLDRVYAGRPLRLSGTRSRYTIRATAASGTVTWPAGYLLDDEDVGKRWAVVDAVSVTTSPTAVLVEATEDGPIALDSGAPVTFRAVTPMPGLASISYDAVSYPSDSVYVGRDTEADPSYRIRARNLRLAVPGPTPAGLRAAVLAIPWVQSVALDTSAGTLEVTVYPAPSGTDQQRQLAQAIFDAKAYGFLTSGGAGPIAIDVPGGAVTEDVYWSEGADAPVTVVVAVEVAGGDLYATQVAVEAAVRAEFSALSVGQRVSYTRMFVAVASVAGVVKITTLTLDGTTDDVLVAATDVGTVGSLSVAVSIVL